MTATATLGAVAASPRPDYSAFTRNWLRIDLALCVLLGVLALLGIVGLARGVVDEDDPMRLAAMIEVLIQVGIAGCGITGNALLLRRQRSGIAFAWTTLFLVCIAIGFSMHSLGLRLSDPGRTCPDESIIGGYLFALFFRVLLNAVYADALRRAGRFLRGLPERAPKAGMPRTT